MELGGPGSQDSSFELVCEKLTEQEDDCRYGDNARASWKTGSSFGAFAASAFAIASRTVLRTHSRIPTTAFASPGDGGVRHRGTRRFQRLTMLWKTLAR